MNRRNLPNLLLALTLFALVFVPANVSADETDMNTKDLNDRGRQEILDLHQFFEDWFNAVLPETDDAFARFSGVMSDDFAMVTPSGAVVEIDALGSGLYGAHGKSKDAEIWIEDVRLMRTMDDHSVFTYIEWQTMDGETRGRRSTVLFVQADEAPNGLQWLHVHETWLAQEEK